MFGINLAQAQTNGKAGSLDTTFGVNGMVSISFGSGLAGLGAFEQSNGDIVVIAQADFVDDFGTGIGLVRLTSAYTSLRPKTPRKGASSKSHSPALKQ
jgi:hypothetical protein